jgi:hypothetical protein
MLAAAPGVVDPTTRRRMQSSRRRSSDLDSTLESPTRLAVSTWLGPAVSTSRRRHRAAALTMAIVFGPKVDTDVTIDYLPERGLWCRPRGGGKGTK